MTPVNYYRRDLVKKLLEKKLKNKFKKQYVIKLKNNNNFLDYFKL